MSGPTDTHETHSTAPPSVRCPFCGAQDAEPLALFGSQLLTEQWYCRACRTPFERVKYEDEPMPSPSGSERQTP
jgi:ring-1,2-phenylacetyl-CoA epoxidase subunit PaaD